MEWCPSGLASLATTSYVVTRWAIEVGYCGEGGAGKGAKVVHVVREVCTALRDFEKLDIECQ